MLLALCLSLSLFFAVSEARIVADTPDYTIWRIPEEASDAQGVRTKGGAALVGGGDNCEPAFSYLISHAQRGDFLVARASSDDRLNNYVYDLSQRMNETVNSVTTVLFKSRSASFSPEVLAFFEQAEAIFFAGGDQSRYLSFWRDSPVQQISQKKIDSGVSVGGTSAGLAILATRIYTAEEDTVYSDEAMENPYNKYMTFGEQFLKLPTFENVVTDMHFAQRNRMGRALTFAARCQTDLQTTAYRVLAVDEETAMLLDVRTGEAQAVGKGKAYICGAEKMPASCVPEQPLQWDGITCHRADSQKNDVYDFVRRTGSGVEYSLSVSDGHIVGQPYGPL